MRSPELLASSCPCGGNVLVALPFGEGDDELPNFSMALPLLLTEIAKIWDCVSECYRQELLLKKVGLVSSHHGGFLILPHPAWPSPSLEGRNVPGKPCILARGPLEAQARSQAALE